MLTFEYFQWFHFVARRNTFTATTRGVFQYILELAVERQSNKIPIANQDEIATVLGISPSTLDRSLNLLRDAALISTARRKITIHPPAESWVQKYLKRTNWCEMERRIWAKNDAKGKSPIVSRAQKVGAGEENPPERGFPPPQGDNLPPPKPQAKALSAQKQLELYKRLGWAIPIELQLAVNKNPDEPWERKEGGS